MKLIGKISRRFEVSVSDKLVAQAIPLVGALGGATVNVLFAEHFNAVARYHFGLRHLERRWGAEAVHTIYREAASEYQVRKRSLELSLQEFGTRRSGRAFAPTMGKPR